MCILRHDLHIMPSLGTGLEPTPTTPLVLLATSRMTLTSLLEELPQAPAHLDLQVVSPDKAILG
jgi:hypothetical protein